MIKIVILYDSVFGNTKKVAMALCRGLEEGRFHVDCYSIYDFEINRIKDYDVIAIGGPTHIHGASKNMKYFLNRIKKFKMKNKYGFAFDTKYNSKFAGSAAKRIKKSLRKMKLKIIDYPITGFVNGRRGPLKENTLELIERIGLKISDKINKKEFLQKQEDLIK